MRQRFHLAENRGSVLDAIRQAPPGHVVEIFPRTRSNEQSAKMWATLGDIARQVQWLSADGSTQFYMSKEDWKLLFLDAIKREQRLVLAIDGRGVVNIGNSSSRLTSAEMSDLIVLAEKFAAERGVKLGDPWARAQDEN